MSQHVSLRDRVKAAELTCKSNSKFAHVTSCAGVRQLVRYSFGGNALSMSHPTVGPTPQGAFAVRWHHAHLGNEDTEKTSKHHCGATGVWASKVLKLVHRSAWMYFANSLHTRTQSQH